MEWIHYGRFAKPFDYGVTRDLEMRVEIFLIFKTFFLLFLSFSAQNKCQIHVQTNLYMMITEG